jgi:topoisomerase-4 subunit A
MTPAEGMGDIREAGSPSAWRGAYLAYALSTIMARSLPDVRDGLSLSTARLLYAMRELRLIRLRASRKCARVVGDVIGKYHPHGDVAVYDALVRLAQDLRCAIRCRRAGQFRQYRRR